MESFYFLPCRFIELIDIPIQVLSALSLGLRKIRVDSITKTDMSLQVMWDTMTIAL